MTLGSVQPGTYGEKLEISKLNTIISQAEVMLLQATAQSIYLRNSYPTSYRDDETRSPSIRMRLLMDALDKVKQALAVKLEE
jgi:hypothetical protein